MFLTDAPQWLLASGKQPATEEFSFRAFPQIRQLPRPVRRRE